MPAGKNISLWGAADPSPSLSDFGRIVGSEFVKSIPWLGPVFASIERIHAEHEAEALKKVLLEIDRRTARLENYFRSPEGLSLLAHALRLASKDMLSGKERIYVDALESLLPEASRDQAAFESAIQVLDDLYKLNAGDLAALAEFRHCVSVPLLEFIDVPTKGDAADELTLIRTALHAKWPVIMRLQAFGLLIEVSDKPLQAQLFTTNELKDYPFRRVTLTDSGQRLVRALRGESKSAEEDTEAR